MSSQRQLEISTPSDTEIVITRGFAAPRQLVWDGHTKPELVKQWLTGPPGWSMPVCEIDLKVGGKYRYEWAHESGNKMGMGGVFRAVDAPALLSNTQKFDEDWTGGEVIGSLEFSEQDGGTLLRNHLVYSSKEARDGALGSGMTQGMEMGYASLDALLASL
jgi:uncharacterized protein YndB with AHSA1/START domain